MDIQTAEIERLREARVWSLYQLGLAAGLPRETVRSAVRRGSASLETVVRLAGALEVPIAVISPEAAALLRQVQVD